MTTEHKHEWDSYECTGCDTDWWEYQTALKNGKRTNLIFVFDCVNCGHFYGEQTLTEDGRLLCPSCYGEQHIEADWVEAVPVNREVEPFIAGILCDACGEDTNRDGYEAYCYKCDPSFAQV